MSKKTRVLAMVARAVRSLMFKRKMIDPFAAGDFTYEKDRVLRPVLWSLSIISSQIKSRLEAQGHSDMFAVEIDGMAIELAVTKKINEGGCDAAAIVQLIKRNAPKRIPGTEQAFVLFF